MKNINCIKCQREIDLNKDFIKLIEYIKGKENRVQYFHINCYEESFDIKKMALNMVARANKLMGMAGLPEEDKVIEVAN